MSFFSSKKPLTGKTIALFDIENGSIAVALTRFSPTEEPRVFAEKRFPFSIPTQIHADALLQKIEASIEEGATHLSEVAARVRAHPVLGNTGVIEKSIFFLGAPWGKLDSLSGSEQQATAPRALTTSLKAISTRRLGDIPASFHMFSRAATHTISSFYPNEASALCIISGEMTELIVIAEYKIAEYATFPIGLHTILRTLVSHSGISMEEARSALILLPSYLLEAIHAAQQHFLEQLFHSLEPLATHVDIQNLFIIAHEPYGEWFAQTIVASDSIATLFSDGGVVRALRATQFAPFIAAHAPRPDLFILLETLFANSIHRV